MLFHVIAERSKAEQGLVIGTSHGGTWYMVAAFGFGPMNIKCMSWFWPPEAPPHCHGVHIWGKTEEAPHFSLSHKSQQTSELNFW